MLDITERQRDVLDFIFDEIQDRGRAPTIGEIMAACKYRHDSPVLKVLLALEKKRYISRATRRHRGIEVLRMPI